MSVHVEWLNARSTHVSTVTQRGEFSDAYGSVNDGFALQLSCDEVVLIEGTREELEALAQRIADAVEALPGEEINNG